MDMKIIAIIQARMGSRRLLGKVMMKINGITVLECLFSQLAHSKLVDDKILATTIDKEDDLIFNFAVTHGLKSYRGNSTDVLDRYYQCAKNYSIEHIVRITSDCPLIDPSLVDQTIRLYKQGNFDYVNNFSKKGRYPPGTEVEVFSFDTLEKAWKMASKSSEREHVTPYIYNNPQLFSISHIEYPQDLSHLHWAVDRVEDLEFVKLLYKKIPTRPILLENILETIKKDPQILEINKNINPYEGYLKSLQEDENPSNNS